MSKFPKIVFSDFDGTLTKQGKFSPVFFDVLSLLKKNSSKLVVVTGRPLSWAHFLLTHFDLDCVITEGGGAISTKNEIDFTDHFLIEQQQLDHLETVANNLLKHFDGLKLSSDSACRVTDRAIDLKTLKDFGREKEIEEFLALNKINFSRSNVHLNFWAGQPSKRKSIEYYLSQHSIDKSEAIFIGDSLNDESAFEFFDRSIGVSNIKSLLHLFKHPPKIVLEGEENDEIDGVINYLKNLS